MYILSKGKNRIYENRKTYTLMKIAEIKTSIMRKVEIIIIQIMKCTKTMLLGLKQCVSQFVDNIFEDSVVALNNFIVHCIIDQTRLKHN